MWRVIDISSTDQHLALKDNSLAVFSGEEEKGRIHLSDIAAVTIHSYRATLTKSVIVACAEHNIPIVYCDEQHAPASISLPVTGHHRQTLYANLQAAAPVTLKKRLWQAVVRKKIAEQARSLEILDPRAARSLKKIAGEVKSGDPDNREAFAARLYWSRLLGDDFRRDRALGGLNAHLNYGYTVLRSAMARSITTSGLIPSLGLHHRNLLNPFCLADDLFEPYRPLVDRIVRENRKSFSSALLPETKALFANLINMGMALNSEVTTVQNAMNQTARSLVSVLEKERRQLSFPDQIQIVKQYDFGL